MTFIKYILGFHLSVESKLQDNMALKNCCVPYLNFNLDPMMNWMYPAKSIDAPPNRNTTKLTKVRNVRLFNHYLLFIP